MSSKSESHTTTDHKKIQKWAEYREGKPSVVESTYKDGSGLLRINFPGYAEDNLKEISWDDFLRSLTITTFSSCIRKKLRMAAKAGFLNW
jgi:hypothetical protein